MRKIAALCLLLVLITSLTGCYSVFTGGTGGLIVDAESEASPKTGIPNVDVYAYTDEGERNSEYNRWTEGTRFSPQSEYYGHTTTDGDGRFSISRLIWKSWYSEFGRDADYTKVYLLYYHESYGLTKGSTILISDSTTDTVYAELTKSRLTTPLTINLNDVSTGAQTEGIPMHVKVTVPQTTATDTTAAPKVYETVFTGTGTIGISYPRWQSAADKAAGIETEPTVTIEYVQSSDEITWLGCYNGDNDDGNYAFRADDEGVTTITKQVRNTGYTVNLYGKSTQLSLPSIEGQYLNSGDENDDGVVISLVRKDESGAYTIPCGQTTTRAQTIGTSSTQKHGTFSGLGTGYTWIDETYTGRFVVVDVKLYADGTEKDEIQLISGDISTRYVQL